MRASSKMANQILHYFRVRKGHKASTDSIVTYFKKYG